MPSLVSRNADMLMCPVCGEGGFFMAIGRKPFVDISMTEVVSSTRSAEEGKD